jgi:hypothetical protein
MTSRGDQCRVTVPPALPRQEGKDKGQANTVPA